MQFCKIIARACSETTLTGVSRFHISTPVGIEPGSLMTGSKWVDHRTPPQQLTMLVVKPEGGSSASMKPGQKSCVRSSGIITLSV